ncbi:MAG: hypothetical protein ACT4PG_10950, partial [Panacagrimonas sp.]
MFDSGHGLIKLRGHAGGIGEVGEQFSSMRWLQPSTANSSLPISPCSSHTNSTSRNTEVISTGILAMKDAMVV